jgi:hypothetical protein
MTDLLCSSWATVADIPEDLLPLLSEAEWDALLLTCSEILWALSGRQWSGGGCVAAAELRACPPAPGTKSWPFGPMGDCCGYWPASGYPWSFSTGVIRRGANAFAVQLPHDEVTSVTSVTVNGEPFLSYRLEGSWLERTDCRSWQECGDADVLIEYVWGLTPPAGGVRAVVTLAIEIAKQATGDATCRLPRRVVSVTRQGVTMAFVDPMRFLKDRLTGLPDVDMWIMAVNPYRRPERAQVWSPDVPRAVTLPPPAP